MKVPAEVIEDFTGAQVIQVRLFSRDEVEAIVRDCANVCQLISNQPMVDITNPKWSVDQAQQAILKRYRLAPEYDADEAIRDCIRASERVKK